MKEFFKTFLLLCLLSSFCCCSVLKNKHSERIDSLSRKVLDKTETHAVLQAGLAKRLLVIRDSSGHQYSAEIIPKGVFHFSATEGFTGEALKLAIKGEIKNAALSRDSASVRVVSEGRSQGTTREREESEMEKETVVKQVKRAGWGGWVWWVVGVGIVGLVVWVVVAGVKGKGLLGGIWKEG